MSDYRPRKIPSPTWRECIKKVWEIDPLACPKCGGEMKIIKLHHRGGDHPADSGTPGIVDDQEAKASGASQPRPADAETKNRKAAAPGM